jgi:hypothetical protein
MCQLLMPHTSETKIVIYQMSAIMTFFVYERIICGTSHQGPSASFARMCRIRLLASKFVQYFLKRTLCLICRVSFVSRMTLIHALVKVSIELTAVYFHSFEIFIIQIGEMAFCKLEFIIIKSNYFQNAQKGECFLDDFKTLVREIDVHALVFQNHPNGIRTSARTSISRTTMRSRDIILKVVSSKNLENHVSELLI